MSENKKWPEPPFDVKIVHDVLLRIHTKIEGGFKGTDEAGYEWTAMYDLLEPSTVKVYTSPQLNVEEGSGKVMRAQPALAKEKVISLIELYKTQIPEEKYGWDEHVRDLENIIFDIENNLPTEPAVPSDQPASSPQTEGDQVPEVMTFADIKFKVAGIQFNYLTMSADGKYIEANPSTHRIAEWVYTEIQTLQSQLTEAISKKSLK